MDNQSWLKFPTVVAPSPDDPSAMWTCAISPIFVERNNFIARKTPVFQLWAHVVGQLPPINLIGTLRPAPTLLTLKDAIACFKGVQRPYDTESNGESVLVYVLKPWVSLAYQPSSSCLARSVTVPPETVLTVQIRPSTSLQKSQPGINGIVTRLEFVSSVGSAPPLPVEHEARYCQPLWKR